MNKIITKENGDMSIQIKFGWNGENLLEMIEALTDAKTQMQNAGCPIDELKLDYYDYNIRYLTVDWPKSHRMAKEK